MVSSRRQCANPLPHCTHCTRRQTFRCVATSSNTIAPTLTTAPSNHLADLLITPHSFKKPEKKKPQPATTATRCAPAPVHSPSPDSAGELPIACGQPLADNGQFSTLGPDNVPCNGASAKWSQAPHYGQYTRLCSTLWANTHDAPSSFCFCQAQRCSSYLAAAAKEYISACFVKRAMQSSEPGKPSSCCRAGRRHPDPPLQAGGGPFRSMAATK